jgi:large subunit ribosomal protein L2
LPLSKIPVGSFIHNISLTKDKGATISRSAGTYSILIEKNSTFCKIRLSSGVIKVLSNQCFATMGILSNSSISLTSLGKAGRSRWLNIRPTVRGVAMNPIDHPHGGGEGKTSGGRKSSVSPWGKPIFSRRKKK